MTTWAEMSPVRQQRGPRTAADRRRTHFSRPSRSLHLRKARRRRQPVYLDGPWRPSRRSMRPPAPARAPCAASSAEVVRGRHKDTSATNDGHSRTAVAVVNARKRDNENEHAHTQFPSQLTFGHDEAGSSVVSPRSCTIGSVSPRCLREVYPLACVRARCSARACAYRARSEFYLRMM